MVVARTAISVSRSSLARDGILLSCLVEMVRGEVVVEVVVEVMGEIGKGSGEVVHRLMPVHML